MSVLYERLLRAQQKCSKSGEATDVVISGQEENSFLAGMESLYSPPANSPTSNSEAPSFASLSASEDIPARVPKLPRQMVISNTLESPEGVTELHGFRRLLLPHQEETRLVFRADPQGLAAEQFRLLRRTLRQEFATGAVLMITSPGVGDGNTLTALNLSACLAESGDSTLLMEVDVRRPAVGRVLGCEMEAPGIEDAFAGRVEPGQAVNFIGELSLHAAIVTKIPNHPSHLMNGAGVKRFLAWAREHFRWVVLDAAPVLPAADVAELLPFAAAVLLVIRAQSTPRELSRRAFEVLGKRLHGVIFNEATIDSKENDVYVVLGT
jgi:Mrp family chromosome partitioning ATPase